MSRRKMLMAISCKKTPAAYSSANTLSGKKRDSPDVQFLSQPQIKKQPLYGGAFPIVRIR